MNQTKKVPRLYNGAFFPTAGDYSIDPVHSFVDFIAQHLMVGQIRGSFHPLTGNIKIADDPTLSSLEISIDTASISTHNEKRDEDIRYPLTRFLPESLMIPGATCELVSTGAQRSVEEILV